MTILIFYILKRTGGWGEEGSKGQEVQQLVFGCSLIILELVVYPLFTGEVDWQTTSWRGEDQGENSGVVYSSMAVRDLCTEDAAVVESIDKAWNRNWRNVRLTL